MKNIVSLEDNIPIDIKNINIDQLQKLLDDELVIDDIRKYLNDILKEMKKIKSISCNLYNCKMTDIVLRDMVIISSLLDWIEMMTISDR